MQIAPTTSLPLLPGLDTAALQQADASNTEHVAESFESVFASMLVKEMRNTLPEGLFAGEASDVFGGMFDLYMGQAITGGQGLGIKQLVLSQLLADPEQPAQPPAVDAPERSVQSATSGQG